MNGNQNNGREKMTTTAIYEACQKIARMKRRARRLHIARLVKKTGINVYDLNDIIGLYLYAE